MAKMPTIQSVDQLFKLGQQPSCKIPAVKKRTALDIFAVTRVST